MGIGQVAEGARQVAALRGLVMQQGEQIRSLMRLTAVVVVAALGALVLHLLLGRFGTATGGMQFLRWLSVCLLTIAATGVTALVLRCCWFFIRPYMTDGRHVPVAIQIVVAFLVGVLGSCLVSVAAPKIRAMYASGEKAAGNESMLAWNLVWGWGMLLVFLSIFYIGAAVLLVIWARIKKALGIEEAGGAEGGDEA